MPTRTETREDNALLWTARAALVGQLGLWAVTPFVLVGGGLLGVSSHRNVVGDDVDVAAHVFASRGCSGAASGSSPMSPIVTKGARGAATADDATVSAVAAAISVVASAFAPSSESRDVS